MDIAEAVPAFLKLTRPVSDVLPAIAHGMSIYSFYADQFLRGYRSELRGRILQIGPTEFSDKVLQESANVMVDRMSLEEFQNVITQNSSTEPAHQIGTYDCILSTITLSHMFELKRAIALLHRMLKPGGTLLLAEAGIQRVENSELKSNQHYWNFTSLALQCLLGEVFPNDGITIKPYGNVMTAIAALHGLSSGRFKPQDLNFFDRDYEVLIGVCAVKP
jgi:hypothetical protein